MSKYENNQPKYLDTIKIAKMYDVSTMFFKGRIGKEFKRGVHYIQRDERGAIRWCVEEIEAWWRNENAKAHSDLVDKLMPKAG